MSEEETKVPGSEANAPSAPEAEADGEPTV